MKKKIDLTIAIVSYKTPELLKKCLTSIYRYTKNVSYEIRVVENSADARTQLMLKKDFPRVKLIINRRNIFATRANNQILKKARGKYSLILNSDVELISNAIYKLKYFLDTHPEVAGVTCRQILPTGKTDIVCSRFFTPIYELAAGWILGKFIPCRRKIISQYRYLNWDRLDSKQVQSISDIILLARTDIFKQAGFYDEHIKLYYMEDDLSVRISNLGYGLWYLGTTGVLHQKGASVNLFSSRNMYRIYESDMLYYYRKHFGPAWFILLKTAFLLNRIYYRINNSK